jgi:hypothetical protein
VGFEQSAGAQAPVVIQVDADLTATSLTVTREALEATRKTALEAFLGALQGGGAITFDQLATALRDDAKYALVRSQSVIGFDQEGQGFTELRDNDPAYAIPANSTLRVRNVRIKETTT